MDKNYKYNAFISYRHNDLDKFVAENLHRLIETYKMPKPVVEKYDITDNNVRRVFRDQEELPLAPSLEKPIITALKESKFLIVICSPRLKESKWCKKEIENFIKFHGREKILCVLVEGEPEESFPEELLYEEVKTFERPGNEQVKRVSVEPLAMDVRGNNKSEVLKNIKRELIRLIAPMYNLDYDDIKRRHEERELKKKVKIFRIITLASIIFALYSGFLFLKIYNSSNKLKYDQAINLANSSKELLEKDSRNNAIKTAYQSVTKYNKNKMPVTTKGIYQLTESLGVYYSPENYYALTELSTSGIVESIKTDINGKYLLSYDNSGELVLWNLYEEKRITTITDIGEVSFNKNKYTFINNNTFAYQNNNKEIVIMDMKGKIINKFKLEFGIKSIVSSVNGKYLAINMDDKLLVYNTENYEEIVKYNAPSGMTIMQEMYFDDKDENLVFSIKDNKIMEDSEYMKVITYNISSKNIISSIDLNSNYIIKMLFNGDTLIMLTVKSKVLDHTSLITSYKYKEGIVNYSKTYIDEWGLDIDISESSTILVSSYGTAYYLDYNTGDEITRFSIGDKMINTFSLSSKDCYISFTRNGEAHIINGKTKDDIIYIGLYNFNLSNYEQFVYTDIGIVSFTSKDNRIIIYGKLVNKKMKQIDYKEKKFDTISYNDREKVIKEYNFKDKNLISNIAYSKDKKILFVSYTNNNLKIYDNNSKKLLNTVEIKGYVDTYLGKTKNNEHIIKGLSGGYILNKDFELIAYVPYLYDYNDDKLILKNNKFYSINIYTVDELIKTAEKKIK